MSRLREFVYKGYCIGAADTLSEEQCEEFITLVKTPVQGGRSLMTASNRITVGDMPGIGSVVVKHYRRGGLFGHLVHERYLSWGKSRPHGEYILLDMVRKLGIHAPEPIAYATKGRPFYRGWLMTREVPTRGSLVDLALQDPDSIDEMLSRAMEQLALMIEHRIYHVDLHPGNVLITPDDQAYIVDFDKAVVFQGNKNSLRDRYLCRWRRAVLKHELPETLCEQVCARLRQRLE